MFLVRYQINVYVRRKREPSARGYNWAHPVPGGYKYGKLALQVGGVSDEAVKYGYGF
jgi:hypothetical protein